MHENQQKNCKACWPLPTYTESEAAMTVKSVTGLDGVDTWSKLHANYRTRMMGRMFRVQRE